MDEPIHNATMRNAAVAHTVAITVVSHGYSHMRVAAAASATTEAAMASQMFAYAITVIAISRQNRIENAVVSGMMHLASQISTIAQPPRRGIIAISRHAQTDNIA